MRRTLVPAAALLATALACAPAARPPAPPAPLRLACGPWPGHAPALLASELGWFREEGVDVALIRPEQSDERVAGLAAGDLDAIAAPLGDVLLAARSHPDVRIVLVTDVSAGADAIVARPGLERVADLRGRRIGVRTASSGEALVAAMLERHGLRADQVHRVDADGADVPALIARGAIDAGHTWEPYLSQSVRAGNRVLFSTADPADHLPSVVAIRGDWLRAHPAAARGFVRAWLRAAEWGRAHPDSARAVVARAPAGAAWGTDARGVIPCDAAANRDAFADTSAASLAAAARRQVAFLARRGAAHGIPDPAGLLDAGFLPR